MTEFERVLVAERARVYTTTGMAGRIGGVVLKPGTTIGVPEHEEGFLTTPRPDGHVHRWPCRIFCLDILAGTEALLGANRQLVVQQALVVEEVPSKSALGPHAQADKILNMAGQLRLSTLREQEALAERASRVLFDATIHTVRDYARLVGRDNSIAVMGAMLVGSRVEAGAHRAACAAALAVAYDDLLVTAGGRELYDYLYEPWEEVMDSPYF